MAKKAIKPDTLKPEDQITDREKATLAASHPAVRGAMVGGEYAAKLFGEIDQEQYCKLLAREVNAARAGDLSRSKAMLAAQANTLDLLFNSLMRKAVGAEYLNQFEAHLRLALKAQAQASHTVKVLGELEHPKAVAFVKQANIAHGPQQVNNAVDPHNEGPAAAHSRVRGKSAESTNELLEIDHGNGMDAGTAGKAGRGDPALETVDAIDRPEDRSR